MKRLFGGVRIPFVLERNVATLSGSVLLLTTCMFSWYPVLALFLRQVGASDSQVGLTYTVMALGFALPQLAAGVFSDRFGRKLPVTLPTFGFGILYIVIGLLRSWAAITACFFIVSLMQAFQRPSFSAMLAESVPEGRRGMAFGTFEFAATLGATIGPFLGAALLSRVDISGLILINGLVAIVAGIIRMVGLREHVPAPSTREEGRSDGWRRPAVAWHIVVATGLLLMNGLTLNGPFASLHAHDIQGLAGSQVNLLFAFGGIGSVVASVVAGRLVDRVGGRRTMGGAVLLHAVWIVAWASLAPGVSGTSAFFLATAFMEASVVANSAVMVSLAHRRSRATVVGVIGTISGFSAALGPTIGAAIRAQWGSMAPFWAAASMAVIIASALPFVRDRGQRVTSSAKGATQASAPSPQSSPATGGSGPPAPGR